MTTDFGKFCRKLRIDHEERLKDMADKLGVTSSYLSAIEKGSRRIPSDWAEQLAIHYKLTSQQLAVLTDILIIDSLSSREKSALSEAVSAIYFNDSSDYLNGLWGVVRELVGHNVVINEGFEVENLYDLLNPESRD